MGCFLKAIFIAICLYPEEWLKLVTEALKEMREISVSRSSLENDLQLFWDIGFSLAKVMTADANALNLYYDLCAVIVIAGVFIGVFVVLSIVVINTISFTVLLALAPFAFYCLIFGNFLKPIFKQWWNLTLACVLTFIFLKIFMSFGMDVARSLASLALNSPKTSYAKCAGYVVLAGLIIKFIASLITGVVEKLVGVSVEGSVKNAATGGMQTAGLALGGAAIAGKSAIKGQFQALGKAFGKADNSLKSFKLNKPKTPSGSSAKDTSNG
ncbi:type IV secretion system protein [uncultured Campylobacter sp.]|uniref:type IV secretion system protein n=1 Tax=uncultured Campylobacter sp. TaxID=218934 RepID=UPI0026116029|nr:type IV secretion system protein [uncultured Campylobacter sp.]